MNEQDKVRWASALKDKYGIPRVEEDFTFEEGLKELDLLDEYGPIPVYIFGRDD